MGSTDSIPARQHSRPLSEDAYEQLEELIVTMELAPGTLVTEQELAQRTGLGRTPVREAVLRLSNEYLIEIMPRRGLRIAPIDVRQQIRLVETRRALETLVASQAALRANRQERAAFQSLANAFRKDGRKTYRRFLKIDQKFNLAVAAACDNEFAVNALQSLHGLSRRFWHYYAGHEEDLTLVADMHASIADAIAVGDTNKVGKGVTAHMDYIQGFTLEMLGNQRSSE
ncbi:GntR family transcriptional regulator [Hyphomonas sp.]|uniref:GntR family transcriptional regulator n=1 Tax=Hyphomonas sp. TaxID=87 RepID=UPI001D5D9702|nr:GntR family transcriptional regulator [Hyphomonas sp.]